VNRALFAFGSLVIFVVESCFETLVTDVAYVRF
jgi:hypothetical protein